MVFDKCFAIKHDVIDAGEKALVIIYNERQLTLLILSVCCYLGRIGIPYSNHYNHSCIIDKT